MSLKTQFQILPTNHEVALFKLLNYVFQMLYVRFSHCALSKIQRGDATSAERAHTAPFHTNSLNPTEHHYRARTQESKQQSASKNLPTRTAADIHRALLVPFLGNLASLCPGQDDEKSRFRGLMHTLFRMLLQKDDTIAHSGRPGARHSKQAAASSQERSATPRPFPHALILLLCKFYPKENYSGHA